ncbi:hypothetical protein TRFO_17204 [Tritrichomonas foetus]|uniref:Secreted protein n=1 Tax=Tritrichomonas foetus TaxID=1144522 RepID=A0A1J4KTM1_9EUKA|nr:hypothetical protein TRFO_17204 [Tritrichomonas foetus]|eukprot:OHT12837.1 hypothetical protein TRFO_17204 [Tritrichomonas foetus]
MVIFQLLLVLLVVSNHPMVNGVMPSQFQEQFDKKVMVMLLWLWTEKVETFSVLGLVIMVSIKVIQRIHNICISQRVPIMVIHGQNQETSRISYIAHFARIAMMNERTNGRECLYLQAQEFRCVMVHSDSPAWFTMVMLQKAQISETMSCTLMILEKHGEWKQNSLGHMAAMQTKLKWLNSIVVI